MGQWTGMTEAFAWALLLKGCCMLRAQDSVYLKDFFTLERSFAQDQAISQKVFSKK